MRKSGLLICVLILGTCLDSLFADPDLPNPTSSIETIPSCSLVIPMDTANQPNGAEFNLRAYGLAVHLLWNNIPLKWIIRSGKQYEGIDMTASVWKNMTASSSDARQTVDFRAGPIVIPVSFAQFAIPLINEYNSRGGTSVKVWKIAAAVTGAHVRYTLKKKPFVAVLNSSTNYYIQTAYLADAGLLNGTHYRVMTKDEANSLNSDVCVSLCTEPHFEGPFDDIQPASSFVAAMHQFVESGGNFVAECGGIRTYELCHVEYSYSSKGVSTFPNCPPGFFMTERDPSITNVPAYALGGMNTKNKGKPRNERIFHHNPDLAFFQFDGVWDQFVGGSVASMDLYRDVEYKTRLKANAYWGVQYGTTDSTQFNTSFHSAGAKITPGRVGHNVWYITGHDVGGFMPAKRQYMNAVLVPAERDVSCGFDVDECAWGGCGGYVKRADAVPCSCTDVCDGQGRCNGVTTDICPVTPPPVAPRPPTGGIVRTPTAPRPPTSNTPGGSGGSPSTNNNGGAPTTGGSSTPASITPPPTIADFPPTNSPIPYIDVNTTQGTQIIDSESGQTSYFVLVVSPDVYTMQLWVQVLNWDPNVSVEVLLRREGLPSQTENDCAFTQVRELNWDFQVELAASRFCRSPLPSLAGNWIVSIRTPQAVGYSFEAFLEPNYARTTEATITIGAANATTLSLLFTALLALVVVLLW